MQSINYLVCVCKQQRSKSASAETLANLGLFAQICHHSSTERAIALPPACALESVIAEITKMLKFYVKIFKTLYFLNPQMDLFYIWYDYR